MERRKWVWETLRNFTAINSEVPEDNFYGAGSVVQVPEVKPFIVIRMEEVVVELRDGDDSVTSQLALINVHDEIGSYARVERILRACQAALIGPLQEAIVCQWQGDSADLADDTYGTIFRSGSYRIVGGS